MNARTFLSALIVTSLSSFFFATDGMAQYGTETFRLRQHQLSTHINSDEDIQAEVEFGQSVAARVLGQIPLHNDDLLSNYVNLVGLALVQQGNRPEIDFHFAVLDADFINAYSAPGGYVFITRGALFAMQDEAELAAVLAHEIGHITERHIVKEHNIRGRDTSALSTVSNIIGGAQDSARVAARQAADKAIEMLFTTGPKHEDELAADETALLLLANTGYDPLSLHRFLSRMSTLGTDSQSASKVSHPPASERIKHLEALQRDNGLLHTHLAQGKERFQNYVRIQR